jgi:hypothetical protein
MRFPEKVSMSKLAFVLTCALFPALAFSQSPQAVPAPAAPPLLPKVLLLVYQQFVPGKAGARQALEIDTARNFDRLEVPVHWIEVESLTGPSQALFLDPADSFTDLDKAGAQLAQTYAAHPELAQAQQQLESTLAATRTITAFRRDDLSRNLDALNLARARYLRVSVVQVAPEHEGDFLNSVNVRRTTTKPKADAAWAVYQVNSGLPEVTFLYFEALRSMADVDRDPRSPFLPEAAGANSIETALYAIHPEMSHVSPAFAAADPAYWMFK